MTYQQTIEYLYSQLPVYHRIGKAAYKADLHNTVALDNYFGSPHRKYASIHVAGTNGKGSVSHMLASVLQEAGFRTGLYTSPHLKDYRERIRVNGEMIPEDEVVGFVERHRHMLNELCPSFFEMSVAMAFDWFARAAVDVAVIETGLGGRLDSTNIITPVLSVITNIGYDHMDLLGDTLGKIATEKAGIVKPEIPVVIGESDPETDEVFLSAAASNGSEIMFADKYSAFTWDSLHSQGIYRGYKIFNRVDGNDISGETPLSGDYQKNNISTVYVAVEMLKGIFDLSDSHFIDGVKNVIENTGFAGRWQVLGRRPLIICDTGHNSHGLKHVMQQIRSTPKKRLHIVAGFVNDKDLDLVLPLFPEDAVYYFTKASVPRAMDEKLLAARAASYNLTGKTYGSVPDAVKAAKDAADEDDMIFIGGSTFVVAEAI